MIELLALPNGPESFLSCSIPKLMVYESNDQLGTRAIMGTDLQFDALFP